MPELEPVPKPPPLAAARVGLWVGLVLVLATGWALMSRSPQPEPVPVVVVPGSGTQADHGPAHLKEPPPPESLEPLRRALGNRSLDDRASALRRIGATGPAGWRGVSASPAARPADAGVRTRSER